MSEPHAEQEPDAEQDAPSLVGRIVADRYEVEALLGAGAMGMVYRARHVHMQKLVALKVLHQKTSESSEVVSRFEREAVAAGRIAHPNVAAATDFGRLEDNSFYLVLEFVQGRSLGSLLEETGALPLERALSIAGQIAQALAAAHHADIVHRDLKPENVMLVERSEAGPLPAERATRSGERRDEDWVKVLDFGLAKLQKADTADTQLTMVGAVYGTPQYMSPEQAAGQPVDHRADLYALGLILYEMLAGHPPFSSEQMVPLLLKHMTEAPPQLPAHVPRAVRQVVSKLLAKDPSQRFGSADEALQALEDATPRVDDPSGRTVVAVPLPKMPTSAEVKTKLGQIHGALRTLSAPAITYLRGETVLRGRRVPRSLLAGAAGSILLGFVVVLFSGGEERAQEVTARESGASDEEEAVESRPRTVPETIDPELRKVIDAARQGSDAGLYALERRDDGDRSIAEWLALSQARLVRKQIGPALSAFQQAIAREPEAAEDKLLLGALRFLADKDEYYEEILEFVAKHLGPRAPDFLFDVWSGTSAKTQATTLAWELLDSSSMRSRYSPALELALQIRARDSCADRIALLPAIAKGGDERSMLQLREMKKDKACEKKAGQPLDDALTQAALRKAPRFPLLRRFRFK